MVGGSVRAGETEVVSLVDTEGVLGPYAELFPRVTEHDWAPWRERYPELFDGVTWELAQERRSRDFIQRALLDLADRVETVAGEVELAPEVIACETPGPLAGHMSVCIGDELLLLGDVGVHPAQLVHADWHYVSDADPKRAEQTRGQVLDAYGDWKLACGHFPAGGFGRLADDGTWTPIT